jgi:hypothetical protein
MSGRVNDWRNSKWYWKAVKERPAASPGPRPVAWTTAEVMESITQADPDAASAARTVLAWSAGHGFEVTGGAGRIDRSVKISADAGMGARVLLSLYATPSGGRPLLEIQVKQMLNTPPFDGEDSRARLKADLTATGIARLADQKVLETVRPNLYLDELTGGRVERLLSVLDRWIEDVRTQAVRSEDPG